YLCHLSLSASVACVTKNRQEVPMSLGSLRLAAYGVLVGLIGLTSCGSPTASTADRSEFYWSAARETYLAGDYVKAADHLEHIIETNNAYTARAVPWYLVLTSGMAEGYMVLADQYAAGAHIKKEDGLAFRRKATDYRTIASKL